MEDKKREIIIKFDEEGNALGSFQCNGEDLLAGAIILLDRMAKITKRPIDEVLDIVKEYACSTNFLKEMKNNGL